MKEFVIFVFPNISFWDECWTEFGDEAKTKFDSETKIHWVRAESYEKIIEHIKNQYKGVFNKLSMCKVLEVSDIRIFDIPTREIINVK